MDSRFLLSRTRFNNWNRNEIKKIVTKEEDTESKPIDNEFEALSETKRVYSKTPLNSDYVIAHLNEAERDLITETVFNNDFACKILKRYATTEYIPKWNIEEMKWEENRDGSIKYYSLKEIDNDNADKCINNADKIFNMFMLKTNAIAILGRNTEKNFMLKYGWFKSKDEEKPIVYGADDRSMMEKIQDKMSGNEYPEEGQW